MKRLLIAIALCSGIARAGAEGIRIGNWPATYPVTGPVAVSNFPDSQSVSNFPAVQTITPQAAASATLSTSVAISSASVQAAVANAKRKGLVIYNASTSVVFIAYDEKASTTHLTYPIAASSAWTMPTPIYLGTIAAVRGSTGDGKLLITELN